MSVIGLICAFMIRAEVPLPWSARSLILCNIFFQPQLQ